MKKLIPSALAVLVSCLYFVMPAAAQQKTAPAREDIVVMQNGEEKHGKITEVDTDIVKFMHSGETLLYTLKKSDISKITFASGRIEMISHPPKESTADQPPYPVMTPNLVAILPFKYRQVNGYPEPVAETKEKLQDDTYAYLSKRAATYRFQDPQTTNALLFRRGIDENTIRGYTYAELCSILGVEYIIHGSLSRSSRETVDTYEGKEIRKEDNKLNQTKVANTTVDKQYNNEVSIMIYNSRNDRIYSNQRTALMMEENSYWYALAFMLKRCPLYR
ncbi:hypothetical protein ECE50_018700 [Chitinophaga sp. Mgbs1]|uniref:Uncharacterized protein n=1 Tax=Chitinophaga solisilvae TaxID=1233460 RepID=A0A9Q5D8P7_9BACT|nr:hypothetical protein [Chitinophaga solisilvae]